MTQRPICLITGASAGIGAACARLAAADHDLVLNYRSNTAAAEAVKADAEAQGARAVLAQGDVADPAAIAAVYKLVDDSFGRLDVLINNAGIVDQTAKLTDMDHARLTRMMNVNVIGAMLVAKEAVIRMQAQGAAVRSSTSRPPPHGSGRAINMWIMPPPRPPSTVSPRGCRTRWRATTSASWPCGPA